MRKPEDATPRTVGKLTLVEAAGLIERLEGRAAHERELEALRLARDAMLVIVSEGYCTLAERLRADRGGRASEGPSVKTPPRLSAAGGAEAVSYRAASSPPR